MRGGWEGRLECVWQRREEMVEGKRREGFIHLAGIGRMEGERKKGDADRELKFGNFRYDGESCV